MDELPVAFSNWTLGTSPKGNQRYFRIWSFVRISTIAILPSFHHHCFHCFFCHHDDDYQWHRHPHRHHHQHHHHHPLLHQCHCQHCLNLTLSQPEFQLDFSWHLKQLSEQVTMSTLYSDRVISYYNHHLNLNSEQSHFILMDGYGCSWKWWKGMKGIKAQGRRGFRAVHIMQLLLDQALATITITVLMIMMIMIVASLATLSWSWRSWWS